MFSIRNLPFSSVVDPLKGSAASFSNSNTLTKDSGLLLSSLRSPVMIEF